MTVVEAYIGLGSNLGEPVDQVCAGLADLHRLPDSRVLVCSSLYRTAAVGFARQPDFINAVCRLKTALSPGALLEALLHIETKHGRVRTGRQGGPRILDLDLLLYGRERLHTPELILPHPRLHERAFVLYPLCEIAPAVVVPGWGLTAMLLSACADQKVERLGQACRD